MQRRTDRWRISSVPCDHRGVRWLCIAIASACGSPPVTPLANHSVESPSLFPAARTDCTRDGWCRFADPLPIRASSIYVTEAAVYISGHREEDGPADESRDTAAIARWDGSRWKVWHLAGVALFSIDGYGDRIWASGRAAPVYELVGDQWRADERFVAATSIAVGPGDVLLAVNGNILLHTGPETWTELAVPTKTPDQRSVYSLSADDSGRAWAVVSQLYGDVQLFSRQPGAAAFEAADTPRSVYRVSARTANDVAAIGRDGLRRWDGSALRDVPFAADIGFSALVHRGTDLAVLGPFDEQIAAVAHVDARGVTRLERLPDDPDEMAAGPDGSLWACSSSRNQLWFRPP
jgi:hypothetical protein